MTTVGVLHALRDRADEKIKKIRKTTSANYLALLLNFGCEVLIILEMGTTYRTDWFLPATVIINFINIIAIVFNVVAIIRLSDCALKAYLVSNLIWFIGFGVVFLISISICRNDPDQLTWFECIRTMSYVGVVWLYNLTTFTIIFRAFYNIIRINSQIKKEFKDYLMEKALTDNIEELHFGNEGPIKQFLHNQLLTADYIVKILILGLDSLITSSEKTISTGAVQGKPGSTI